MGQNDEGKFNVATGAVLENNSGELLIIKRSPSADYLPNTWETVSGRKKQFEDLESALRREIQEETGIGTLQIIKPLIVHHFYRGDKVANNEIILVMYWCKTSETKVILSAEHSDYKWVKPEEALAYITHPEIKKDVVVFIKEKAV